MRIVEAQEAERSRLAQEIHDGPAQALTNAIFQVEYIERVIETPTRCWPTPSSASCASCSVASSATSGRSSPSSGPPMLDQLGLDGRDRRDAVEHMRTLTGLDITTDLAARREPCSSSSQRTVALRVAQEALQNVRKHAARDHVTVATRLEDHDVGARGPR